jgi:hypothetical protein
VVAARTWLESLESARATDGQREFFVHRFGDFVTRRTALTMDVSFTEDDAGRLAAFCVSLAGAVEHVGVAFYPWVERRWRELSAADWRTHVERQFPRRRFPRPTFSTWVVGAAASEAKLAEVVLWAWTLPGQDTLLLFDLAEVNADTVAGMFQDDREEDPVNETALLAVTSNVLSRGDSGTHIRLFSTKLDGGAMRSRLAVLAL